MIFKDLLFKYTFQFTHPGRGATGGYIELVHLGNGFNSRTPGGVRLRGETAVRASKDVSIHAPREGCDISIGRRILRRRGFNSRTPGGVRLAGKDASKGNFSFQFTHPGRGATTLYLY